MSIDKTACFTGPRAGKLGIKDTDLEKIEEVRYLARKHILEAIGKGYKYFIVGGATGFDTYAALEVLGFKENFALHLELAIPNLNQEASYSAKQKADYKYIRNNADKVTMVSNTPYNNSTMRKRNEYMVSKSSLLIAYGSDEPGGTRMTINIAKRERVKVIDVRH